MATLLKGSFLSYNQIHSFQFDLCCQQMWPRDYARTILTTLRTRKAEIIIHPFLYFRIGIIPMARWTKRSNKDWLLLNYNAGHLNHLLQERMSLGSWLCSAASTIFFVQDYFGWKWWYRWTDSWYIALQRTFTTRNGCQSSCCYWYCSCCDECTTMWVFEAAGNEIVDNARISPSGSTI